MDAHSLDDVMVRLRDKALAQGVCGIGSILDCRVREAVSDGKALEAEGAVAVLLHVLVDGITDGRDIVPA